MDYMKKVLHVMREGNVNKTIGIVARTRQGFLGVERS